MAFATSRTIALLRRLAAKVAFERFAQLRGADFLSDGKYDLVRDFILTGSETRPVAGPITNSRLLNSFFRSFSPPHHAIHIVAHPRSDILGAFVVFYGLFFFWVILSERYHALGPTDDLLIQDPRARLAEVKPLRGQTGTLLVDWSGLIRDYLSRPDIAIANAGQLATARFRKAIDTFYDDRDGSSPEATSRQD